MRYVIIDEGGAPREYFDSVDDLLEAVDEMHADDPGSLSAFAVLKCDSDGERVGPPIEVTDLVAHEVREVAWSFYPSSDDAAEGSFQGSRQALLHLHGQPAAA